MCSTTLNVIFNVNYQHCLWLAADSCLINNFQTHLHNKPSAVMKLEKIICIKVVIKK